MKILGLLLSTVVLLSCSADLDTQVASGAEEAADVDLGLMSRLHFNIQVRDFDASRAFYRMLGFTAGQSGFPTTNTHAMAWSLGMYDLCTYELHNIEIIDIPGSWGPATIDLIQFTTPYNDDPPYASPTHVGMAYAALLTTDLASDVAFMKAQGVVFLSEPYGIPGSQYVFFKDLDGVFYKLVERAPPHGDPDVAMHITAMPYVALNVTDFERSYAFYRMLGYTETVPLPETGTLEEARAYGLDRPFRIRGADMALPRGDRHSIRLVQWLEPDDDDPPYPPPINHIGIDRLAVSVLDLDSAVEMLESRGEAFLSEIAPCCSGTGLDEMGIINLIDPDGIFIELVGPIRRREPPPPPEWCPQQ